MPTYEGWIIIRESSIQWRFNAKNIEDARIRLHEEIDRMVGDSVKAGVGRVEK